MPVHFTDGRTGLILISKEYEGATLMHYRVGGEKKGVRRWQDKGGSLTPEGYKHYAEMYGWGKGRKKAAEEPEEKKVRGPSSEESKHRMRGEWGGVNSPDPEYSAKVLRKVHISQESLSEIKKISKGDDISRIRKDINHRSEEPEELSNTGREYNCPNCACAFEMVERGYDVVARRAVDGSNVGDIEKNFKGGHLEQASYSNWEDDPVRFKTPKGGSEYRKYQKRMKVFEEQLQAARREQIDKLREALESQGAGARGIIVVGWLPDKYDQPGPGPTTMFHALNYKIEPEGYAKLYDAQSYRKANGVDDFGMLYGCDPRELHFMRTDNLELDESITKRVYSRGRGDR